MLKVTSLLLKTQGKIVIESKKLALLRWCERTSRTRVYYYVVEKRGVSCKYVKRKRLAPWEFDYCHDRIETQIQLENGNTYNNKKW
jgi:hypothetical protein